MFIHIMDTEKKETKYCKCFFHFVLSNFDLNPSEKTFALFQFAS